MENSYIIESNLEEKSNEETPKQNNEGIKSSWIFDFYKYTNTYGVEYFYWQTPHKTDSGFTQLTMIHALAYTDNLVEFGADQQRTKAVMTGAHQKAFGSFMKAAYKL